EIFRLAFTAAPEREWQIVNFPDSSDLPVNALREGQIYAEPTSERQNESSVARAHDLGCEILPQWPSGEVISVPVNYSDPYLIQCRRPAKSGTMAEPGQV